MKNFVKVLLVLCIGLFGVYFFVPEYLVSPFLNMERRQAGLQEKTVNIADHKITYLDRVAGEQVVIMVHGFAVDKDNWTRLVRDMPSRFRAIALDLPGHGKSTRKPEARYDIKSQVERLHAFTLMLGIEKFHLLGSSMGGQIAAVYASMYPERVHTLALLAPAGVTSPRPSAYNLALEQGHNPLLIRSIENFEQVLNFTFVEPPFLPYPVKRYFAEQAINNAAFNAKIFQDLQDFPVPMLPHIKNIHAPTLLLWGQEDRVLDVSAVQVIKPLLRKSKAVVMPRCGHAPMLERPNETAKYWLSYIQKNGF